MGHCWAGKLPVHHPFLLSVSHRGSTCIRHYQVNIYQLRRETFNHAKNWLKEVKTNGNSYIEIILVGNKNDLEDKRQVTEEEGKLMAAENHISFI